MEKYCLLGEKLGHSYSTIVHEKMGLDYALREVKREDIPQFLKEGYSGFNVTVPYKKEIIKYLDDLDEFAKMINSVNTVISKNGKLYGYTTDVFGMGTAFEKNSVDINGKNVMILGTGGTKNVAYALCEFKGAKSITVVGRSSEVNYSNCYDFADTEIIINATPIGTYPNEDGKIIDLKRFPRLEFVFDCNYNPLATEIVLSARELGIKADGGLIMLIAQALKSEEIWTGKPFDEKYIDPIYAELVSKKRNIVLIGMAGSGKSAIGKALAKAKGLSFIDTDEEVLKKTGKTPEALILEGGEEYFRNVEEEAIRSVSLSRGSVIATGGGAILRDINMRRLQRNGVVVYVEREVDLLAVDGRPLSQKEGVKALFEKRKPIYERYAQITVQNNGALDGAIALLEEKL